MGYRRSYYLVHGFPAICPWFNGLMGTLASGGVDYMALYGRHNTKHGACLVHGERFFFIFALTFPHLFPPPGSGNNSVITLSFSGWAGEFSMDLYPVAWAACHSGLRQLGISRDQRTVSRLLDRRAIGHDTHGSKQGAHSGKGGWECVFVGLQRHAWLPTYRERERQRGRAHSSGAACGVPAYFFHVLEDPEGTCIRQRCAIENGKRCPPTVSSNGTGQRPEEKQST